MSTGVVAVREKGRAGRMCTVYSVVVGIGKAEDGSAARVVPSACKSAVRRREDTSSRRTYHKIALRVQLALKALPSGVSFSSTSKTGPPGTSAGGYSAGSGPILGGGA